MSTSVTALMSTDRIVIVGGGVIGSSIAYHLCHDHFVGAVTVVERDPTYRRASSFLAMGGVRQQFNSQANIRLAQYSVRFYQHFDDILRVAGHTPRVHFRQRGYLFLVNDDLSDRFEERYKRQRALGAMVKRLNVNAIRDLVPDLALNDIRFGIFGPDDGYADPRNVLAGFRAAAGAAGAEYVTGEVIKVQQQGGRACGVTLKSGEWIAASAVVNAAGPFAASLGVLAHAKVPVMPVRQQLFRCALPQTWPYRFPVVIDPSGVHWRHEDPEDLSDPDRIVVARTKLDETPGENFTCDMSRWEHDFRPPLVMRLPALSDATLLEGWAGLYEMTPDHNPVLGEHPDLARFYIANGFSGHGLMMAPAVGAAMAELIRDGRSMSIDITPFDIGRFARDELFWDDTMI